MTFLLERALHLSEHCFSFHDTLSLNGMNLHQEYPIKYLGIKITSVLFEFIYSGYTISCQAIYPMLTYGLIF